MKKFLALLLLISIVFCFASCGDDEEEIGTGACSYAETRDITGRDIKYVEICFEGYGKCVVLLDATTAPKTVENFISLVESGFYDAKGGEIHADGGIIISAGNVTLCNATVYGCITVTGRDAVIQNCKIRSNNHAFLVAAADAVIRNNEIDAPVAISVEPYSENILVAQNTTCGDIKIDASVNVSVVLNRANNLTVTDSVSVAVSANNIAGRLTLEGNDYLICDNNCADAINADRNKNFNGDNITDENARPEYGTNDDILPHTNKDLFVAMTRKTTVADANYEERVDLLEYIKREAAEKLHSVCRESVG